MNNFCIITNEIKDQGLKVTNKITEYLISHGKICTVRIQGERNRGSSRPEDENFPEDADCVVVLGGDGTLLRAAREVVDKEIPLCGINLGTLGYLAEIDVQSIFPALDHLMNGEYEIETRMMLTGSVYHCGSLVERDIALNDIVISREGPQRIVRFNNYVNDEFLNSYKADGIIVSTPTGSTGYSLSAGGPIVTPEASMMLMTPLAPHTLNSRSIVFPGKDKIIVEIGEGRDGETERGVASFDGDTVASMVTGDRIVIEKSEKDTRIVKISNISFLETLRKKMNQT